MTLSLLLTGTAENIADKVTMIPELGWFIGLLGLALTTIFCGIGSSIGLKASASAAAGVMSEDASMFSKVMILVLLPATQGLYGFVIAIIGGKNIGTGMTLAEGWQVFAACLPMMVAGFTSAIFQGKTSATTIMAAGKKPEIAGKAMLFPAMIEFYALLGLVVSIILLG